MEEFSKSMLAGVEVSPSVFCSLRDVIAKSSAGRAASADPAKPELIAATAAVLGTSSEDAYLNVEMLIKGHEFSPLIAIFAIPGCAKIQYGLTINKTFSELNPELRHAICDYWRSVADTLTFRGNGLSVEDSKK